MAIAAATIKIVINGRIRSVQDWSTSVWLLPTVTADFLTQANLNIICGAVEPLVNTWWTALKTYVQANVDYRGISAYLYNPGSTKADLVAQTVRTPVVGGGGGPTLPAYCSLVASYRTSLPGRSGRGRSYFPLTSAALGSGDLQAPAATAQAVSNAYAAMLTSINSANPTGSGTTKLECVVASFTKGLATPITGIVTDTVPDTQHRREDKLGATAVTSAIVTP